MALLTVLLLSVVSFADTCPVGNIKACQDYLKKEHSKMENAEFVVSFDQVCGANPKFSCVKIIVRGDMVDEKKEQLKRRGPKAAFFEVASGGETYLYVLNVKTP